MKDANFRKKLALKKVTIAHLNPKTLRQIYGGVPGTDSCLDETCNEDCPGYTLDTRKTCPPEEVPNLVHGVDTGDTQ